MKTTTSFRVPGHPVAKGVAFWNQEEVLTDQLQVEVERTNRLTISGVWLLAELVSLMTNGMKSVAVSMLIVGFAVIQTLMPNWVHQTLLDCQTSQSLVRQTAPVEGQLQTQNRPCSWLH